ncbi:hypothetical protein [Burkholderia lata]|uniref:hypothetical protein n=1 Tax=Burkholderia lata (strain ATCC 17760 / DSM 23089 / LMG 22485 / NCIMB 9086 / R18194 / 383) TaxID=482957 RepID=UPI00158328FD|nr:hypothetical protein [Burkholderia lata]
MLSGRESFHSAASSFSSEVRSHASEPHPDVAELLSEANSSRHADIAEALSRSSSSRRSNASQRFSQASSELSSRDCGYIDMTFGADRNSIGSGSSDVFSLPGQSPTRTQSDVGTSEAGSFHLSERGDVGDALQSRRLAYSTDSSRRLTSYEGSSVASDTASSSVAITRSDRGSLTPSSEFAVRAALVRGRLSAPSIRANSRASTPTDLSSLHLSENEDLVGALDTGRLYLNSQALTGASTGVLSSAVAGNRRSRLSNVTNAADLPRVRPFAEFLKELP